MSGDQRLELLVDVAGWFVRITGLAEFVIPP